MYRVNIIGAGFVGLTLAEVLSKQAAIAEVTLIDSDEFKINNLIKGVIHVNESGINLKSDKISYSTSISDCKGEVYFVCVGTPNINGSQDPSQIYEAVRSILSFDSSATIIIKSTTLPEYIDSLKHTIEVFEGATIITNPEFLAEGSAVSDLMNQGNLIIGSLPKDKEYAIELLTNLFEGTFESYSPVGLSEAMVIKYFLNSYKAQKITFYNQFHTYCKSKGYSFNQVKSAVSGDPVLGKGFDKPGIGYGGSCFPKDVSAIGKEVSICRSVANLNEESIYKFIAGLPKLKGTVLLVGKSFKLGTNDIRESISVKVGNALSSSCQVIYFDNLPELSDLNIEEVIKRKDEFECVIVFDEYPVIHEIFKDSDTIYINTRLIN